MSLKPKILRTSFREANGLTLIDAPWRHKYFDGPRDLGCFICRAIDSHARNDARNLILVRGERGIIMLNRYPYTMGSLMVAPNAHLGEFQAIEDETMLELTRLVKQGMGVLERAFDPKGFNIGINQGEAAGAGLRDHLHIHVVPRWVADTNFMTATAETRVLAEDVDSMYRRLKRAARAMQGP